MGKRVISTDVLQRLRYSEDIIYNWILNNKKSMTVPEECFEELVKAGVYTYNSKGKAHNFREDLRNIRDNNRLDVFTKISITQESAGRPWIITAII